MAEEVRGAGRGWRSLPARIAGLAGEAWQVVGIAVLLLLLAEALARVLLPEPGLEAVLPGSRQPPREHAEVFANRDEARAYWREFEQARHTAWQPYVYWRRRPYSGQRIEVDGNGFRRTLPAPAAAEPAIEIWVFGGSTAWGTGSDDADTIPSLLAAALAERLGRTPRVLNFAESGYVSQQALLALQSALRCPGGQPPALALFVDGVNDVYAALQAGVAGRPQNEMLREREFLASRRIGRTLGLVAGHFEGLGRLAVRSKPEDDPALAGSVVQQYLATVAQARALGSATGFSTLHVWQPHLFTRRRPSLHEQAAIAASARRHRDLQLAADAALAAAGSDVLDLSALLADHPGSVFIDYAHVGREGNHAIVAALLPAVLEAVDGAIPRAPSPSCRQRPVR